MKEITENQLGAILSLSIVSLKFFVFPALIARYSLNNAYISVAISLIFEFVAILITLRLLKNHQDCTLKEIFYKKFGVVFSKLVFFFLMIFFIIKSVFAIEELLNFFDQLLFENISWWKFFVPIFCLFVFVLNKSLKVFARALQFFFPIIVLCVIVILVIPLNQLKLVNLLPIMGEGFAPVIKGVFLTTFHFTDYCVLLLLLGNVKYTEKTNKKVLTYVILTDIFILTYFIIFIGLFGVTVVSKGLAVSQVPMYTDYPTNNGRLEWLSIIIWTNVLVFQGLLMLLCAKELLKTIINVKTDRYVGFSLVTLTAVITYYLQNHYANILQIETSVAFNIVLIILTVILNVLVYIGGTKREKNVNKTG